MPGVVKKTLNWKKWLHIIHVYCQEKEKRQTSTKKKITTSPVPFYRWWDSQAVLCSDVWGEVRVWGKLGKKNDRAYNARCIWRLRRRGNILGVGWGANRVRSSLESCFQSLKLVIWRILRFIPKLCAMQLWEEPGTWPWVPGKHELL